MYLPEIEKCLAELKKNKIMVLASSLKDKVTARNMSVLVIEDRIYCQTDLNMEKAKQILGNDQVAFCIGNFQIIGNAKIIGSWNNYQELLKEYKSIHENSYERYKNLKDEIIIETKISKIQIWEYENDKPYLVNIDLQKNEYLKTEYRIS